MKSIKQVILILLVCTMVLGLTACKTDGGGQESDISGTVVPAEDLNFFGCNVIRPQKASEKLLGEISSCYAKIIMLSDDRMSSYESDESIEADSKTPEILIGHTNRPETQEVLSKLSSDEYAVAVVGRKLVITGKNDTTTIMAIKYFVKNYLKPDTTGVLAGDLFCKEAAEMAKLADNGDLKYTLVCPEDDYTAAKEMGRVYSTLKALTRASVKTGYDDATYDPNALQILLGYTDYEETKKVAKTTAIEGYTVDFVGNKIVIFGWTSDAMVKATDEFIALISASSYVDESGKMSISMVKEKRCADTVKVAYGDISFYKNVPFDANGRGADRIYDAGDNAMMLYWSGADADLFTAYAGALTSSGFAEYHSVDNNSIKATTYTKNNASVHVYYLKRTAELRAIVYYDMALPVKPYAYTKVCEPAVTQLQVDEAGGGMSYLVRLEDGTFIVIDGGSDDNLTEEITSSEAIYNQMVAMKPDGVDELVITAWIITHAHADHIGGIKSFAKSVHKDEVALKMIIANDVPDYLTTIIDNPGRYQYYKDLSKTFKDCVYVKANAGQQFFFPGVTVDMLYTPADVYPEFLYEFNAGFCIGFRLTVNESETRDEKTFVFLGDITKPGAEIFAKMYREDLKCDVVQIGHHGHNGGSQEFYQYCDAKTVFLPNTKELYDGGGYKRYPHVVWAMENADKVIMAWEGNYTIWFGADAAANS